jgi:Leucine-rich repeat (LRR) protein
MQQIYFPDVCQRSAELKSSLLIILCVFSVIFSRGQENDLIYNDSTHIYRSLTEAMKNPEKVFRLNLSKQKIDTFPEEIFAFKNLVELDLSKNKLEEIPPGIGTLTNLCTLKLANNKLVHLPLEIGHLSNLVYLGLNRNVLVDLPPTIGMLSSLEIFELWDNELEVIPDEISQLKNLKVLELRGILFTDEEQHRIDTLVTRSAKIHMSPSCNCKN